jgi:plasmid stabilization system protein ParE
MTSYGFHPDALVEYEDATRYYLEQAAPIVGAAFVAAVESAIQKVLASPMTWRVVDEPMNLQYAAICLAAFRMRYIIAGTRDVTELRSTP